MKPEALEVAQDFFDREGDEIVRQVFSSTDLMLSPEEYAARHAQEWLCFSYHRYRYRDATLGAWIRRLGEIVVNEDEIEKCRKRYLTPAEQAEMRRSEAEEP